MAEIPRTFRTELIIPRSARGYDSDEFLHFYYPSTLNPTKFRVLLEDLSGRWITLGMLKNMVLIPNTYFPEHAMLVVVGTNDQGQQIRFSGELKRGAHYKLMSCMPGDHGMVTFIKQNSVTSL